MNKKNNYNNQITALTVYGNHHTSQRLGVESHKQIGQIGNYRFYLAVGPSLYLALCHAVQRVFFKLLLRWIGDSPLQSSDKGPFALTPKFLDHYFLFSVAFAINNILKKPLEILQNRKQLCACIRKRLRALDFHSLAKPNFKIEGKLCLLAISRLILLVVCTIE